MAAFQDSHQPERRGYARIVYNSKKRPVLLLYGDRFEVSDLSQAGLRILNTDDIALPNAIRGRLQLIDGATMDIAGRIAWERNGEIGLRLTDRIPPSIIEREQRRIITGT